MTNRYIIIILTFILISCTSSNVSKPNKRSLISNYSIINGKYISKNNYEYDNSGRLIKVLRNNYENKNGFLTQKLDVKNKPTIYKYLKDSIVVSVNNTWRKIILNKKGLFVKDISPNSFSKTKKLTTRLKKSFNSNDYLIKTELFDDYVTYSYSTIYEYEYSNGNIIKETRTSRNIGSDGEISGNSYDIEYEYFEDKLNSIGNANFGKGYLGNSSKNLIKIEKSSNGYIANYKYEFDKNGNVTKMSIFNNKNGKKTREYTYEYK